MSLKECQQLFVDACEAFGSGPLRVLAAIGRAENEIATSYNFLDDDHQAIGWAQLQLDDAKHAVWFHLWPVTRANDAASNFIKICSKSGAVLLAERLLPDLTEWEGDPHLLWLSAVLAFRTNGRLCPKPSRMRYRSLGDDDSESDPVYKLPPYNDSISYSNALLEANSGKREQVERKAKKKPRRKKRQSDKPLPLTEKQLEAAQMVAECKGNIALAARRLGKDRKTVKQHYEAAMSKLGKQAVTHQTESIPSDRREQAHVANGDDRRRM